MASRTEVRQAGLQECAVALTDKAVKLGILNASDPLVTGNRREAAVSALQLLGNMPNDDDQGSVSRILHEEASLSVALAASTETVVAGVSALRKGTYGKCERCLGDIPLDRMRAVPEATTHVVCPPTKKPKEA